MSSDDNAYSDGGGYDDGGYDDGGELYDDGGELYDDGGEYDDDGADIASLDCSDGDSNDDDDGDSNDGYDDDDDAEEEDYGISPDQWGFIDPLSRGNGDYNSCWDDHSQQEKVYLEYDGASKGNPGRAGAGAVLRSEDGTVITRIREGLGYDTNNGAEYKGLIQGLKTALEKGYDRIDIQGDSKLVHEQVQGHWKTRNDKMSRLCKEAQELKNQFKEFKMNHVPRGSNVDADAEANKGVNLPAGSVQEEDNPIYRRRR